jgi:hypothetical protein
MEQYLLKRYVYDVSLQSGSRFYLRMDLQSFADSTRELYEKKRFHKINIATAYSQPPSSYISFLFRISIGFSNCRANNH